MDKELLLESKEDYIKAADYSKKSEKTCTESSRLFICKNPNIWVASLAAGAITLMPAEKTVARNFEFLDSNDETNVIERLMIYSDNISSVSDYVIELTDTILKTNNDKNTLVKEILSFKSLNNNWDGYGSYPLEVESASNALMLLDKFSEEIISKIIEVYPNPHGTVSMEWENSSKETLVLEIGNTSMSYFVEILGKETIYQNNKPFNATEINKLSDLISII